MQTPFERLAAVLDNASANYLSESQRQQRLADERDYAQRQLTDSRQYAEGRLTEGRTYEETMAEKERARAQEKALIAAGYLSKPLGQNSAEDILAATAKAAQHALAVTEAGDAERKDAAARRDHEAAQRNREAEGWKLNPVKSQERIAMEKVVDGGMLDFGKPAAKMTDEELTDAFTKTRADNIKRDAVGDDYANWLQSEFLKADAASDPTPTIDEIKRARAANPPKSSSMADRQMAEEAAQQMAASIAAQRSAFAMKDRDAIRYLMSDVLKKGHYPVGEPAALGEKPNEGEKPPPPPPPPPQTALGLEGELERLAAGEMLEKDWPEILKDYQLASLGEDAVRQRIGIPVWNTTMPAAGIFMGPAASTITSRPPTAAEQQSRLAGLRDEQADAMKRLAKRNPQLALYAPKDETRARELAAILALLPKEATVKQNNFNAVAK